MKYSIIKKIMQRTSYQ